MIFFYVVYRMPSVAVKFYPALTRFTKTVQLQWYKMECKYICLNVLCSLNISWISQGRSYHLVWKVTQHENNLTMQRLKSQFFCFNICMIYSQVYGKGEPLNFPSKLLHWYNFKNRICKAPLLLFKQPKIYEE